MKPTQEFNDGVVKIYRVDNVSEPGEAPTESLVYRGSLRYKQRTVGFSRYYTALQANTKVATLLRCPRTEQVSEQDVAVPMDGKQYRISLIQYPEGTVPLVMDLTLERMEQIYV